MIIFYNLFINELIYPICYMNDYRKKYLKYKLKYFKKLNMLNQMGGSNSNISKKSKDCCKKTEDHDCCGGHHHYTNLDPNVSITSERDIDDLISWIDSKEFYDEKILENPGWSIVNLGVFPLIVEKFKIPLTINWLNIRNEGLEKDSRPLFILPGFSSDSLGMTISRISENKEIIFSKGFSDIYIFDFTCIGGRSKDISDKPGIDFQSYIKKELGSESIDKMYMKISEILYSIISKYSNYSILGRSAGGGLCLHLVFTNDLKTKGLNIASPGINFEAIVEKIMDYKNKNLPIRMCWAQEDKKNPINSVGIPLDDVFTEYFTNYQYYVVGVGSDDDKITHRILPILIKNLS